MLLLDVRSCLLFYKLSSQVTHADLKQLSDEDASGLLTELATPLLSLRYLYDPTRSVDWANLNICLQRIEVCNPKKSSRTSSLTLSIHQQFFHVLRASCINPQVDKILVLLAKSQHVIPTWAQSTYLLSKRAAALLGRQRGIVLDNYDPSFRPPQHLRPPYACLKVAVQADKEFRTPAATVASAPHSIDASNKKRDPSTARRRSRTQQRAKGPLAVSLPLPPHAWFSHLTDSCLVARRRSRENVLLKELPSQRMAEKSSQSLKTRADGGASTVYLLGSKDRPL